MVFSFANFLGCSSKNVRKTSQEENLKEEVVKETTLILATTTSTQDTGLLDVLVEEFEKLFDIKVKVIAVGTGEALKMGERGDADVLLVHAKDAEEKLVDDGYGLYRKEVMHNFFIVVGPPDDPAGIKGMNDAVEAFKMIYDSNSLFVSRGDDSGTNKKELKIWESAEINPKEGNYNETGQGMGNTLQIAGQKKGYTLSDTGTYF
ncbi:MAG: substrate-binding domain-containing protein, partial [Actinomycetia bacterium]|nr:substrate-binding domain-containing protein [Actinomycetes bacterium]